MARPRSSKAPPAPPRPFHQNIWHLRDRPGSPPARAGRWSESETASRVPPRKLIMQKDFYPVAIFLQNYTLYCTTHTREGNATLFHEPGKNPHLHSLFRSQISCIVVGGSIHRYSEKLLAQNIFLPVVGRRRRQKERRGTCTKFCVTLSSPF